MCDIKIDVIMYKFFVNLLPSPVVRLFDIWHLLAF